MLKKLLTSKNLKNSYWIIGEKIFQMLLSLIVGVLTARYLGPTNYGTLNYTASFVSFFTAIAALGMDDVILIRIIEQPEREGEYLGSAILYRIIAALLSSISISFLIIVMNPNDIIKLLLALIQSGQLLFKAFDILNIWFQRRLQSKYVSIGKMTASFLVASYKVFLLISAKSIVWFAFSNTISDFVIAVVLCFFYYKERGQKFGFSISCGNDLLKNGYHYVLPNLMAVLYSYMDRVMLGKLMTDTEVGYYSTAVTISSMWMFVPLAIIQSYRPSIVEMKKQGKEDLYLLRLQQLMSVVFWLSTGVAIILAFLGKIAVSILYGNTFLPAATPIIILVWAYVFSALSTTRGIWCLCEDKISFIKRYVFLGLLLNLILNFLLIPLIGMSGAAIATLFTEFFGGIVAPAFFKQTNRLSKIMIDAITLKWYRKRSKKELSN